MLRWIVLTATVLLAAPGTAAPPLSEPKSDAERLAGTWLFDAAFVRDHSELARFWTSTLTVAGDSVAVSKFMDLSKDLKGKVVLDPTASPNTIDLRLDEFDLGESGTPI